MKKYWVYIATFLAGAIVGLIAMFKLMGEQVEVNVRKVKNKRTSGKTTTSIPINIERPKKRPKRTREERKAERKERKSK